MLKSSPSAVLQNLSSEEGLLVLVKFLLSPALSARDDEKTKPKKIQ